MNAANHKETGTEGIKSFLACRQAENELIPSVPFFYLLMMRITPIIMAHRDRAGPCGTATARPPLSAPPGHQGFPARRL